MAGCALRSLPTAVPVRAEVAWAGPADLGRGSRVAQMWWSLKHRRADPKLAGAVDRLAEGKIVAARL
jgi:hypothetical protein